MFRERIQSRYSDLTPSFRRLADFILEQPLDAAFMTATELAHYMNLDAATVVRFSQMLGYTGFRELSHELQQVVKDELVASYSPSPHTPDDTLLFQNLLENERHNLALAQARLGQQAGMLHSALQAARRIWVTGQGYGAHLAALCGLVLLEHGLPATFVASDLPEIAASFGRLDSTDAVIGFAVAETELDVASAIRFARECGARTFALSVSEVAPAALAAETSIVCPGPALTHTPSFTGLAALIVALGAALAVRDGSRAAATEARLHESSRRLLELRALATPPVESTDPPFQS